MNNVLKKQSELDDDERIAIIEDIYVTTPEISEMNEGVEICRQSKYSRHEPLCMGIVGTTGSGKTSFAERKIRDHNARRVKTGAGGGALLITIPTNPTNKKVSQEIIHASQNGASFAGEQFYLTLQASKIINSFKPELMFADELNHFVNPHGAIYHDPTDWFKNFIKTTNLPTIFMGTNVLPVLTNNPQLESLFIGIYKMVDFEWDVKKPDTIAYMRAFIETWEAKLPLKSHTHPMSQDDALLHDLYLSCAGSKRVTLRVLRYAAKLAISDKSEAISRQVLSNAFETIGRGVLDRHNYLAEKA